jgi:hypothetical protein
MKGHSEPGEREKHAHKKRVQHDETEVVRATEEAPDGLRTARRQDLPRVISASTPKKQPSRMTVRARARR